jgi:hypothetical protein
MRPQSMPRKERDHLFQKIDKEIRAIETRYSADAARWAMRRHLKDASDRDRLERERERLEAELAKLNEGSTHA